MPLMFNLEILFILSEDNNLNSLILIKRLFSLFLTIFNKYSKSIFIILHNFFKNSYNIFKLVKLI